MDFSQSSSGNLSGLAFLISSKTGDLLPVTANSTHLIMHFEEKDSLLVCLGFTVSPFDQVIPCSAVMGERTEKCFVQPVRLSVFCRKDGFRAHWEI